MKITKPTLIVDRDKVRVNIRRICQKVRDSQGSIRFRPHFKTHQSAEIGAMFREEGINAITVSSLDMAYDFAQNGWRDMTVALLVNPLEIQRINDLAAIEGMDLGLLVDSEHTARFLEQNLKHNVKVWLKIDTGYHRTGLEWSRKEDALAAARAIHLAPNLQLMGLLTHSGHSYDTTSTEDVKQVYSDTVNKMNRFKVYLVGKGLPADEMAISVGDTPTCGVLDSFYGIDEIRCGNFVYYDVIQLYLGACREDEIAAAIFCPVIGIYPHREELVVHCGAVHLSKDYVRGENGKNVYGLVALPGTGGKMWGSTVDDTYVKSVSQEHGIIKTTRVFAGRVKIGDILAVLPAHSCLAANLMKESSIIE